MHAAPDTFLFRKIPLSLANQAFAFHKSQANNMHIWPRTEEQMKAYADNGELFGVFRSSSGEFVALCYSTLDGNAWEIGGVTTTDGMRLLHLGSLLVRFALAHTIVWNSPWKSGREIIAHVHDENPKPRGLLARIGFEFAKKVEIPGNIAPPTMKRNAQGNVSGDEFRFPPRATGGLLNWFEREFKGILADGKSSASFEVAGGIGSLIEGLREAVVDAKPEAASASTPSKTPATASSASTPPTSTTPPTTSPR